MKKAKKWGRWKIGENGGIETIARAEANDY
jgi:hypothetical protein